VSGIQPIDHYDPRFGGWNLERDQIDEREVILIDLLAPYMERADGSLLDVGCGNGDFLAALDARRSLVERGWKLSGIDLSPYQIGEASQRLPYTFSVANVEEGIPFPDSSFDILCCGELIEHLYNPDEFLAECHRVLSANGHLAITTPNPQAWYNRVLFAAGVQPLFFESSTKSTLIGAGPLRRLKRGSVPVGHIRLFNRRALEDLLRSQRFAPLAVRGARFPVLPRSILPIDGFFNRRPSLASNLVVVAERQ
jgi:SAM-dependent methyltransferase